GLVAARLLTRREGARLVRGLARVRAELDARRFRFLRTDEDIHMAIERRLTQLLGPLGGKLHTGRSRNDQVALDLRLWLRAEIDAIDTDLVALQRALITTARRHRRAIMPAYTHLPRPRSRPSSRIACSPTTGCSAAPAAASPTAARAPTRCPSAPERSPARASPSTAVSSPGASASRGSR